MAEENIRSKIWREVSQEGNPFVAEKCFCAGYDVYGDMLNKASWIEYLYLLIKGEKPSSSHKRILEGLAIALANPGPRDQSVHGAMSAAVGGSTSASCLMSALGIGAGSFNGSREVYDAVLAWHFCANDLNSWCDYFQNEKAEGKAAEDDDVWPSSEHTAGFDPYAEHCALPVKQTLEHLSQIGDVTALLWLSDHRCQLEEMAGMPLALSGVSAAAFIDLGFDEYQSEITYLFLRLPGALAHSLEQRAGGWRQFPFFRDGVVLTNDPKDCVADSPAEEIIGKRSGEQSKELESHE